MSLSTAKKLKLGFSQRTTTAGGTDTGRAVGGLSTAQGHWRPEGLQTHNLRTVAASARGQEAQKLS